MDKLTGGLSGLSGTVCLTLLGSVKLSLNSRSIALSSSLLSSSSISIRSGRSWRSFWTTGICDVTWVRRAPALPDWRTTLRIVHVTWCRTEWGDESLRRAAETPLEVHLPIKVGTRCESTKLLSPNTAIELVFLSSCKSNPGTHRVRQSVKMSEKPI